MSGALAASPTFRSLRHSNARRFFAGLSLSVVGTWVHMTAMNLVVYRLTGRATDVGITLLCQFLPMLLLGAWAGGVSDRVNKRRMTLFTQMALTVHAALMGVFQLAGWLSLGWMYGFALLLGVIGAIDNPARRGFVIELVEPSDISNVVALNTAVMTGSRIFGPALAAMLLHVMSPGWLFLLNAGSYLAVLAAISTVDQQQLYVVPPAPRTPHPVREALGFLRRHHHLLVLTIVFTVVSTFAFNYSVTFLKLSDVRWGDKNWFGWLLALNGVGALLGALFVAGRPRVTIRLSMLSTAIAGAASIAMAWAPGIGLAMVLCIPIGAAQSALISSYNAIIQRESPPEMRGRMLALGAVFFLGSTPIGAPLTGWIADHVSAEWALGYGGVIGVAAAWWGWRAAGTADVGTDAVTPSGNVAAAVAVDVAAAAVDAPGPDEVLPAT